MFQHSSNIRQRLNKRQQLQTNQNDREISKSASNLASTIIVEASLPSSTSKQENYCQYQQQFGVQLRRRKSAAELSRLAAEGHKIHDFGQEDAPVLRRRRFTRKQRKSLIIEPETGLILASAKGGDSTSSEEDEKGSSARNRSKAGLHDKGPAARRASRLLRRTKKHASSTSHLEMIDDNGLRNQSRSLSVRDLNGENIDFTNRDSVTKWTSQILAELESLPSSCLDLTIMNQSQRTSNGETGLHVPPPSSRMTSSMFDPTTSVSPLNPNQWKKVSTTSLPAWQMIENREREDSVGASTLIMQSDSDSDGDAENQTIDGKTTPVSPPSPSTSHRRLLGELADLARPDFLRVSSEPPAPPPSIHAPPVPAKRTRFLGKSEEKKEIQKSGVRRRLEEVFNEADRKLQNSISRMTQSVYGDLKELKNSSRFSIPIIRTSSDSPHPENQENFQSSTEIDKLDKWKRMAECRAKKDEQMVFSKTASSIGLNGREEKTNDEEKQSVKKAISALIKTIEDQRYSATDRPQELTTHSHKLPLPLFKNMDFLSQDAGTQTTPFAASRSSSFDWINDPTEGGLRDIQTPASTPRIDQLQTSKPYNESSSDEADREVAAIANQTEERIKSKNMMKQMDEGIALLLEYGEPSAVQYHSQLQKQQQQQQTLPPRGNHYDSLPSKLRRGPSQRITRNGILVDSVYDNMPWDRKRHVTSTGQFSPLVLPRNPRNSTNTSLVSLKVGKERDVEQNGSSANNSTINPTTTATDPPAKNNNSFALQLAERDADEACAWLKQAGFPQYVKQFEEGEFPIETSSVTRDHGFLGTDSLRALFRRIDTLNRCAIMKVDNVVMRRRMNNDYNLYSAYDEDDNVALSGNWQYQRQSQTWSRIPPNETIYGGTNSRLVSTKPNWQMSYHDKSSAQNGYPSLDRQVQRTNWYEAQKPSRTSRPPIDNSQFDNTSTIGCIDGTIAINNNLSSQKLQRSQSERIKDRARAVLKRMDPRPSKRKESRHRNSPATSHTLVIGDPVLVSYDTASNEAMRMMRPNNLPERGRSLYSTSVDSQQRSKSARRQGLVLLTPSSPESSDDSFGGTSTTTSARTSSSLMGGRRRDCSMPPPSTRSIRRPPMNTNYEYNMGPIVSNDLPLIIPTRRRERTPFDAYLYPGSPNSLSRPNRNLTRVPQTIENEYSIPPRDYGGLLQRTDRKHEIVMCDGGYSVPIRTVDSYQHELSPNLLRQRIEDSPSTSHSLKVDTQKSESSVEHTDEENLLSTLHRRRDSGVGSSLSRSPSGPSNQRIRQSIIQYSLPLISSSMMLSTNTTSLSSNGSWQNFKKRNASLMAASISSNSASSADETFFTDVEMARSMDSLNIIEMTRLRKLAYLQITAILEKSMGAHGKIGNGMGSVLNENYDGTTKNNNNWSVHKLIKKMKITDGKGNKDSDENGVFGVGLDTIYRRSGFCLPRPILEILRFLRQMAPETVGIFRKNGVKSRIAELRAIADREATPSVDVFVGDLNLDPGQVHDVADLLKQYLRDLPEPLMTIKMSETFANIFTYVPEVDRLAAVQYALLLMPDENREAVQTLMMFLRDVAKHSQVNNMTAQNLAVCFTPSLFQLSASRLDKISAGSRRHKTIGAAGMPTEKEMKETRACQQCLTMLIEYAKTIFMAPDCVDERSQFEDDVPALKDLGLKGPRSFLVDRVLDMVKDHSDRWKGWMLEGTFCGVEITSKKAIDSHPLKTFRVWIDVEAPPKVVMGRIMKDRHVWDTSVINWRHVEYVNAPDTDIHQYVLNETISHPTKDCYLVRFHSYGLTEIRGACAIAERSIQCSETQMLGGISATVLDQRFLVEPKSGGQSRVTYIARVDLKGRTWQWYNKVYGTIMCRQMLRLRDSFQSEENNGPETKI